VYGFDFRFMRGLTFYCLLQEVRQEPGEPRPRVEVIDYSAVTFELSRGARVLQQTNPRGTSVVIHAPMGAIASTFRFYSTPRAAEVWARIREEAEKAEAAEGQGATE
jgi:hypothetical protein